MTTVTSEYESAPTAPAPVSPGLRIPRREVWVDLPEEYPGFRVQFWVNYPRRIAIGLGSGDEAAVTQALREIVIAHNGWLDEEGNPFPSPQTAEFWDQIPNELASSLLILLNDTAGKLPQDLLERMRSARSARG